MLVSEPDPLAHCDCILKNREEENIEVFEIFFVIICQLTMEMRRYLAITSAVTVIILITFYFKLSALKNLNPPTRDQLLLVQSVGVPRLESDKLNPSRGDSSYLMALSYHEQLNTAIKYELFSLAPVAADWGLKLVEPFVVNSRIYGVKDKRALPIVDRDGLQTALPLTSLFDVTDLLMNCSNVQMVPFHVFSRNVFKRVILIYAWSRSHPPREIIFDRSLYGALKSKFEAAGTDIADCTDVFHNHNKTKTLIEVMEASFKSADRRPKVDRVVCFNPDVLLYTSNFQSYFGTLQDTVVILLNWRGCFIFDCSIKSYNRWQKTGKFLGPNGYSTHPNNDRYRLITRSSLTNFKKCTKQPVPHPKEMIQTANKYLDMLNKSKPLIGIHLRTERMSVKGNVGNCHTNRLKTVVGYLLNQHAIQSPSEHLLVVSDYTETGSDSCNYKKCGVLAEGILSFIYKEWNVRPTVFQPELTGSSANKGFVSLVEMTMLTNVDYLVLLGHGNFQEQLTNHFLAKGNPSSSLYQIARINGNNCT